MSGIRLGTVNDQKADKKNRELYEKLKSMPKFKSLPLEEKLRFQANMKKTLLRLYELGEEEQVKYLTVEFLHDNINERGLDKLSHIKRFMENLETRHREVLMIDPAKKKERKEELHKLIRGAIDIEE